MKLGRKRLKKKNCRGGWRGGVSKSARVFFYPQVDLDRVSKSAGEGGEERKEVYLLTDFSACTLVGILFITQNSVAREEHCTIILQAEFSI